MIKSHPEKTLVKVVSPLKLDPGQIDEIKRAVMPLLGTRQVEIENIIRKEIIGGIIVEFGSKVIDLSIAGNIEVLNNKVSGK